MSSQSQPLSPQKASKSVKGKLRFSRKQKNPTGEMTLVEHLQELRRRDHYFRASGCRRGHHWVHLVPASTIRAVSVG